MKIITPIIIKRLSLATVLGFTTIAPMVRAASFSVSYGTLGAPVTKTADTYYNELSGLDNGQWDNISTVFHAPVTLSEEGYDLESTLSARHYDSDPTKPGETGLLDRAKLAVADPNLPQWILKHGLPPSVVGSTTSATLVNDVPVIAPASYVSFKVRLVDTGHGEQLMFDGADLTITGFLNIDTDSTIWAASNSNDFSTFIIPSISQPMGVDTDVYTFNFSNLGFVSNEFEIRVYGVLGQDQGTFSTAIVSGSVTNTPIPEPSTMTLGGGLLLGMALRRRRRAA